MTTTFADELIRAFNADRRGRTRVRLATEIGITPPQLVRLMKGERLPNLEVYLKLARIYPDLHRRLMAVDL